MRGKKLLRILAWVVALQAIMFIVGQVISRRMTMGDESSDVFQVAAIFGGKKFHSEAHGFRSGTAIATMGGVDLDLRDATLDPAGAELEVKATMGGVQVVVPEAWAVDVESEGPGGFEVTVTPPEDLPDDAPKLHIHAMTVMGGGAVTTKAA